MNRLLERQSLRTALMLAPALAVIMLFFGGGLIIGLGQSVDYVPTMGLRTPTLRHYVEILSDQNFYVSLGLTLYIAFASTMLATVLALMGAMILRRNFRGNQFVTMIYQLPLPVPHLVAAAGIVMLLTQSGIFARIAYAMGRISQPADFPALIFDRAYVGVILVYTWKEIPFIGLVVLAVLKGVGLEYEEAAQTLGAGAWQRFRYVLLPLIMPGIISTSIIVFAFLFGAFEIPLLLGIRHPNTLPVTAYRAYISPDLTRRPEAMAMGIIIALIAVSLLGAYRWAATRIW